MNIQELIKKFSDNKVAKPDYIAEMYKFHDILYQYSEMLRSTDIQAIEIRDNNVVFTSRKNNIRIIGIRHDQRVAPIETLNFREYEPEEMRVTSLLVRDGDTILDIGANIGWFSLSLAREKNDLRIHAFEPVKPTYENLVANIKLNGVKTITPHNIGLSNKEEVTEFYYYEAGSGNASKRLMDPSRENLKIHCKLEPMDQVIQREGLNRVDFIKCDVEGAEYFTFQGGFDTIKVFKPIIFTEMLRKWAKKYDYHPNDIINFLAKLEYNCFFVERGKLVRLSQVDDTTEATNFFFLTKKHLTRTPAVLIDTP
jgi:FkbM family methyltransferase